MRRICKVRKVSAAVLIGKLKNEFIQKEQDNPFDEHFSEARQEFLDSNPITRTRKPIVKRIKPAGVIAHTKRVNPILDAGKDRNKDQVCEF